VVTDPAGNELAVGLGERNAQSLHDDYVKFIRFAEWRIERTGKGVLGFITNHGYLDNPTFRGMRQHLLRTFDQLYVLDLGGNPIRSAGRDDPDENIFDIKDAGVAIALFAKTSDSLNLGRIFYRVQRGTRAQKELFLRDHIVSDVNWEEIAPDTPDYLFVPRSATRQREWERHRSLTEIFTLSGPGIKTGRDALTIQLSPGDAWAAAVDFARLPEVVSRDRWKLGPASEESKSWRYQSAHADVVASLGAYGFKPAANPTGDPKRAMRALIRPLTYRPFDTRWTLWTGTTQGYIAWPSTGGRRLLTQPSGTTVPA
jgi:predicted helicase